MSDLQAPSLVLENARKSIHAWQDRIRDPSLTVLLILELAEHGNINTPLELAIRNETDRFTLAMDAIDRIPRVRFSAGGLRDELANQRIACEQYAYRFGIDRPDITAWKWPF